MNFPTFEGINSTYRMEADNADIRKAIVQAVPKATEQTKEMASGFSGSSDQETCKKIFDFLKNQIKYKADGQNQIIRYPSALLKTRTGDCKSYSLLTAAILNNLKIPCRFVLQSFNEDPTPSHIYVETLTGIKVDAVFGTFNQEKPSTFQYTIPMNVKYMSGISGNCRGNTCIGNINGSYGNNVTSIGAVLIGLSDEGKAACLRDHPVDMKRAFGQSYDNRANRRKLCEAGKEATEAAQRAANFAREKTTQAKNYVDSLNLKKYFGSIPRQITLGMYSMNIDGLASNINNTPQKAKLLDGWIRLGGDPKALNRAIVDGSSKKPIKIGMRASAEKKIRDILNKNKIISGVDNVRVRSNAKKILMEPGLVSDAYMSTLIATGGTFGGIVGGTVGSAIPVVGNAAGATVGAGMGSSLGYFLFEQTPNLIDAMFPVDGSTSGDTTNQGDSTNQGGAIPFTPTTPKTIPFDDGKTSKAGFGAVILPVLIGVGVLMALNKSKN